MTGVPHHDIAIVGGGHNALVAAAYLARSGLSVEVLERLPRPGGGAVSAAVFPGVPARLSRYAYLVGLLPDRIVTDLGLRLRLRPRGVASYTPVRRDGRIAGLLIERDPGPATASSFREFTGSDTEFAAWRRLMADLGTLARRLAPTLLEPLRDASAMRQVLGPEAWERFVERPLGETIEASLADDAVRGLVLTDGLIGTFAHPHGQDLRQNRCFLYHVTGNGTGEWRVPVGGMGAVTDALVEACRRYGVRIRTHAEVTAIDADETGAEVRYVHGGEERRLAASYVLSAVAPATLDRLRGRVPPGPGAEGSQLKLNLLLTRLPRLRTGVDPRQAFAGTLHAGEGYDALTQAYDEAAAGRVPAEPPLEVYCHTLTDPSILDPALAERGRHTLTAFGLQLPARLFAATEIGQRAAGRQEAVRQEAVRRSLAVLDRHLEEPIEDCLATDGDGRPCLEVKTPQDIEADLGLPGGHIFAGDLQWPWAEAPDQVGQWGVETDQPTLLVCGSGARRGGGVSGLGGHNAAHALLDRLRSLGGTGVLA